MNESELTKADKQLVIHCICQEQSRLHQLFKSYKKTPMSKEAAWLLRRLECLRLILLGQGHLIGQRVPADTEDGGGHEESL